MPTENLTFFLIGGGIGLISAIVGAILDYFVIQRRGEPERSELPGCMFIASGSLGFAGMVALLLALLFAGTIRVAVVMGLGVLSGFFLGFVALFVGALLFSKDV